MSHVDILVFGDVKIYMAVLLNRIAQAYEELLTPSFLIPLILLVALFKLAKILSQSEPPKLHYDEDAPSNRMEELVKATPMLGEPYRSPRLWGRNGHVQTAVYGIWNYKNLVRSSDARHRTKMADNTMSTFDVFEPLEPHPEGDFTMALCPGIANHSQNDYIKRFFHHAQEAGFRCAILNHVGALKGIPLTTPRIFSYGSTEEYHAMVKRILDLYPTTRVIVVGFSMGGNIVTKWLGTQGRALRPRLLCGMSICQGYDATAASQLLLEWSGARRLLNYIMTEKVKSVLRNHKSEAVKPHVRTGLVNETAVFAATSLTGLDEAYSRRVHGFDNLEEYYRWCSCLNVIDDIEVPMIYLNSEDDPLIPPCLWEPVRRHACSRPDTLFVLTKHGGHLGYMEGSSLTPHHVSWLDRFAVDVANTAIHVYGGKADSHTESETSETESTVHERDPLDVAAADSLEAVPTN